MPVEKSFEKRIPGLLGQALLRPHFENHLLRHRILLSMRVEDRRTWLFALGASWLAGLLVLAALALLAHFSSYLNAFTWMWAGARRLEPPVWMFWLGDARASGLLFCALLGFLPSFVTGWGGWAWVLAPAGLFPGILSIAGGWSLVLGERLGLWVRACCLEGDRAIRKDLLIRTGLALFFVVLSLATGSLLRDALREFFQEPGFNPWMRFVEWSAGLALFCAAETLSALIVFHFYFRAVRSEEVPETWVFRSWRPLSPWDRRLLRSVRVLAERRWNDLRETLAGLDAETQSRIPGPVIEKLRRQLDELESLRQKSEARAIAETEFDS